MFGEFPEMKLKAIGIVRNDITQHQRGGWKQSISEIEIDPALTEALDGLEEFSHLIVLFWMNQLDGRKMRLRVHPRGEVRLPMVGLLTTRSPRRPNPIGKTTVRLLERRGNILRVEGIDAMSGTPVIDIKPYIPRDDSFPYAKMPHWVTEYREIRQKLDNVYLRLMKRYGPQGWWPAEEDFEMMAGAILTQSASWKNVEKALEGLKAAKALSPEAIRRLPLGELAEIIRPSGYYNAKAAKLKALAGWLGDTYDDDLSRMFARDTEALRRELLSIHGIGPETADSIILYAARKPVFVIDTYTRRIVDRLRIEIRGKSYTDYQTLFMNNLPTDSDMFNEYHALLVCLGKNVCRPRPRCAECCLKEICPSRV